MSARAEQARCRSLQPLDRTGLRAMSMRALSPPLELAGHQGRGARDDAAARARGGRAGARARPRLAAVAGAAATRTAGDARRATGVRVDRRRPGGSRHSPPPAGGSRRRDGRLAGDGRLGADPRYPPDDRDRAAATGRWRCSPWSAPESCATWRSACGWRCAASISPARPTACVSSSASSYAARRRAWSVPWECARRSRPRRSRRRSPTRAPPCWCWTARPRTPRRSWPPRPRSSGRRLHVRDLLSYYESEFEKVPLTELTPAWFLFEHPDQHRRALSTAVRRAIVMAAAGVLLLVSLPLIGAADAGDPADQPGAGDLPPDAASARPASCSRWSSCAR